MGTVSRMSKNARRRKQGTFEYAKEKVESCYGHLIVWSRPLRTQCLVIAIAFHIAVLLFLLFRDNEKITHAQPLIRIELFRR